jgi:hypothetical protein
MIKEFFAKLTGFNQNKSREFQRDMARRGEEVDRLAKGLVRERELMRDRMADAQEAEKARILSQRENVNPNEQLADQEKRDRAA